MTLEQIKDYVEEYFDTDLSVRSRKIHRIKVRFLFYYYVYNYCTEQTTFEKIGKLIGFHHSTVMHGLKEYENLLLSYPQFKKRAEVFEIQFLKELDKHKQITDTFYFNNNEIKAKKEKLLKRRIAFLRKQLRELNK